MITKVTIYSGMTRLLEPGNDKPVSVGERIEFMPDGTVQCAVQVFRAAALGEHREFVRQIAPELAQRVTNMLDAVSHELPPTDDVLYLDGWGIVVDRERTERIVSGFHYDLMYHDIRLSNYLRSVLKAPELYLFDGRAGVQKRKDWRLT